MKKILLVLGLMMILILPQTVYANVKTIFINSNDTLIHNSTVSIPAICDTAAGTSWVMNNFTYCTNNEGTATDTWNTWDGSLNTSVAFPEGTTFPSISMIYMNFTLPRSYVSKLIGLNYTVVIENRDLAVQVFSHGLWNFTTSSVVMENTTTIASQSLSGNLTQRITSGFSNIFDSNNRMTIWVNATFANGNANRMGIDWMSINITLDSDSPEFYNQSNTTAKINTNSTEMLINYTWTDDLDSPAISNAWMVTNMTGAFQTIAGNTSGNISMFDITGIYDGPRVFEIFANDSDNNVNSTGNFTVNFDTTPPDYYEDGNWHPNTTELTQTFSSLAKIHDFNMTWNSTDGASSVFAVTLELAGINYTMNNASQLWYRQATGLEQGTHTVKFFANDTAGNWNSTSYTLNIVSGVGGGSPGGAGGAPPPADDPDLLTTTKPPDEPQDTDYLPILVAGAVLAVYLFGGSRTVQKKKVRTA